MQNSSTYTCGCSQCSSSVRQSIRSYRERLSKPRYRKEETGVYRAIAFVSFIIVIMATVMSSLPM